MLNYTPELEPGHGSPGQWFYPGRVGSRVKVIYLQTRYCDPVSERTTEWYSSCFCAGNTWTHCAKSALSEHTYPSVTVIKQALIASRLAPCPAAVSVQVARRWTTLPSSNDINNPSRLPHRLIFKSSFMQTFTTAGPATWAQFLNGWQDYLQRSSFAWQLNSRLEASVLAV